jgi:V/A-type H+/Na+-transporting ATPase subunit E
VGYPELLRVLAAEAAREAEEVRASAERERERIVAAARAAVEEARNGILAREEADARARRRAAAEALAVERERAFLQERRRLLAEARAEVARRLDRHAGPALDARLLAEVVPDAGEGRFDVVVDPGAEDAARAALEAIDHAAAARATIRAAEARRGGVEIVAGRLVLDDTLPARLERAWSALEPELAARLFEEG